MHPYFGPEEERSPLGADWRAAERARDTARRFLSGVAPADPAEVDAVLIAVSELVTNAVRHAGGVTGFALQLGAGTVTICVEDASPRPPRTRPSPPSEPGGFGWPLVERLAKEVGVTSKPRGKAVRAVLSLSH